MKQTDENESNDLKHTSKTNGKSNNNKKENK